MAEASLFWDGAILGDATIAPYDDDEFTDVLRELLTPDRTIAGVLRSNLAGYSNNLEVSNPSGETVRVPTGLALIDGKLYRNSGNVDFTASISSRYYRAILRKSFAAQTVRADLLGPGAGVPALTQVDGVTWEVPLATIYNTGSVLTITDERVFLPRIYTENLEDDAVDTDALADEAITAAKIASGTLDYQLIESLTTSPGDTAITFSAIPATYTHLRIIGSFRSNTSTTFLSMRFNGDAGANYSRIIGQINQAGTVYGSLLTGQTAIFIGLQNSAGADGFSSAVIEIPAYAGGGKKSVMGRSYYLEAAVATQAQGGGYWNSVNAITSITLMAQTTDEFAEGCVASLYGIR